MERGSADTMALLAGQSLRPGARKAGAAELVQELAADASRILGALEARE